MKCFKVEYEITKATLTAFVYSETEKGAKEISNNHLNIVEENKGEINVFDMKLLNLVEVK